MTNLPGPGSDPNPVGNLSRMREVAYMMDMERGGGSSPIKGTADAGATQIIRGNGILNTNFQGIKIDQFGYHIYGETITRALFFREADGTLAVSMYRVNSAVDAVGGGTGANHTLAMVAGGNTDHEFFFDSAGHEQRFAGHLVPSLDDAYDLGEEDSPRRWREIHVKTIKFSDGTSFSTNGTGTITIDFTAGQGLIQDYVVYLHTDGRVYHAGSGNRPETIGFVVTPASTGERARIRMIGPFMVGIAAGTIVPGDKLEASGVVDGRVNAGAAQGDMIGIALIAATFGNAVSFMGTKG